MKMFLAGQWRDTDKKIDVTNPYNGEVIDTVPSATPAHVDAALNTSMRLQNGQSLLVCIPPIYDRKDYSWVLLTPQVVEEESNPLPTR